MLNGILVVEFLRHLDEGQFLILKIPKRPVQEIRLWNHVGIQHHDEFPGRFRQGIIDIPSLGMLVGRAREIDAAQERGKLFDLIPFSIVQDIGPVRIFYFSTAHHRRFEDLDILIVGGDEDIHR